MMASFGPGAMPASILFQQTNPKRAGSKSYDRYEQYKSATSYAEFLELGGSRADFLSDRQRGFIEVEGAGGGGCEGGEGGEGGSRSDAQISKPARETEPSVYHVKVVPADIRTPFGPSLPS